MPIVTFRDEEISCSSAIKGESYIHLLDNDGHMIAAFDAVVDFDAFAITDGDWTKPTAVEDCPIAIVQCDGTVIPGPHKCGDVGAMTHYKASLPSAADDWEISNDGYFFKSFLISGLKPDDMLIIQPITEAHWAYNSLETEVSTNTVTFKTKTVPQSLCSLSFCVIKIAQTVELS